MIIFEQALVDEIIRDPQTFLEGLPDLIDGIFEAAQHLSNHGQPKLAIEITNELCLTKRVNEWQGVSE